MSHLGTLISALIDGELAGAELDRASAHLAGCPACRTEAAQLRQLKRELSALGELDSADAVTRRLLAMTHQNGPVTARPLLCISSASRGSHGLAAGWPLSGSELAGSAAS